MKAYLEFELPNNFKIGDCYSCVLLDACAELFTNPKNCPIKIIEDNKIEHENELYGSDV